MMFDRNKTFNENMKDIGRKIFSIEKERVTAYDCVAEKNAAIRLENGESMMGVKLEPNGTLQKTTLTIFGWKPVFYGNWQR